MAAVERRDPGASNEARDLLHSFARRLHTLCDEADKVNEEKKALRAEVKASGFSTKALNAVVRRARLDQVKREQDEAEEALYWEILE